MAFKLQNTRVLNIGEPLANAPDDPVDISMELQKMMMRLTAQFLRDDGRTVHYEALKKSPLFRDYEDLSRTLQRVSLASLAPVSRTAFAINIYNALTIHGLAALGSLPLSILDAPHFWKTTAYVIGGQVFSLDDLEHGVLRGNRPHPTSIKPHFLPDDPRRDSCLVDLDPRVHFALNCGAKSCPAIRVYTESNLDSALDAAARAFCEQEVHVSMGSRMITISKLFQWYRKDFGRNESEVLRFAGRFLPLDKRLALEQLLTELDDIGGVSISYSDYDWQLNKVSTME